MVFTLHRYIFRDLLKTFFLATAVLSLVLGLGTMLRPLREFSVDIRQVPELLFCTLPMTLTMVIPIAALLAATINYGRLAVDNEITACRSSGIGVMTLIYPALALALLVGMATLLLAFHVIPRFAERFENIFTSDVESILYRNIEKWGNLGDLLGGYRIHADRAVADKHRLEGVVVVEVGKGGAVDRIITADELSVDMQGGRSDGRLLLRLKDWTVVEGETAASMGEYVFALPMPSFFRDNIQFKNLHDLKAIREDLTQFREVRQELEKVRGQYLVEMFYQYCDRQFRQRGYVDLRQGERHLRLWAGGCAAEAETKKGAGKNRRKLHSGELRGEKEKGLTVEVYGKKGQAAERIYEAEEGRFYLEPGSAREGAVLTLEKVQWHEQGEKREYHLGRYDFSRLEVPEDILAKAEGLGLGDILETRREEWTGWSETLGKMSERLRKTCRELLVEIEVEIQVRLAFGVSCVALVLLGAALGIVFRSGHLLTAFGISFIPAALCLIAIFTGKHLAEKSGMQLEGGILFLWSGIIAVGILNAVIYRRLLRR